MSPQTRVAVLGAGPGGYPAAFRAAARGMDVTLIDPEPDPGGVCLYRGCIPSKALLHVAAFLDEAEAAAAWGVRLGEPQIDLDRLRAWKGEVVGTLTRGLGTLSRARGVRYVQGRGVFTGPHTIAVRRTDGGADTVGFDHAIIATGSRPTEVPAFASDSPLVMDSTAALELADVPGSLLVVGGGYIGLELGGVYAALGTRVTVVELSTGLLPGADRDLVAVLERRLRERFEAIHLETRVVALEAGAAEVEVELSGVELGLSEQRVDRVLIAVGRRPNAEGLGLEAAGVAVDARGFIETDRARRTTAPHIFAVGDVAGEPMLAHKATHEARVAVDVIAGEPEEFDAQAIPAVVFTDPELGWTGLTEAQARAAGRDVRVAAFPWAASGRAVTLGRTDGLTKLIVDAVTDRVLGVGVVGRGAGELVAEATLAIEMGATADDLARAVHQHPTLGETVMEAAELMYGLSPHYLGRRARR